MKKISALISIILSISVICSFIIFAEAKSNPIIKFVIFENCVKLYAENLSDNDLVGLISFNYDEKVVTLEKDWREKAYFGEDSKKVLSYIENSSLEHKESPEFYFSQVVNDSNSGEIKLGIVFYQTQFSEIRADDSINFDAFHFATFYFCLQEGYEKEDISLSIDCDEYECKIADSETEFGVSGEGIYDNIHWKYYKNTGLLSLEKYEGAYISRYQHSWYLLTENVKEIKILSGITDIGESILENSNGYFAGSKIEKISIPASVKTIGESTFAGCYNLKDVIFEKNSQLETIGGCAFAYSAITEITLPDSLVTIGLGAFEGCYNLKDVIFEKNSQLETIGGFAFAYSAITEITLPDSLVTIGCGAFCYSQLETITIPASVENINSATSYSVCGSTFGDKVEHIYVDPDNNVYCSEDSVVYNKDKTCIVLYPSGRNNEEFTVPDGVVFIGHAAFADCKIRSIHIPDTVEEIGISAFARCSLTEVNFPDSISRIGNGAFAECMELKKITFPETGSISMDCFAFEKCSSISSLNFPASIIELTAVSFADCDSLETVTIYGGVSHVSTIAFTGCDSLSDIYFLGEEDYWNEIYNIGDAWMLDYPALDDDVNIHFHIKHNYISTVIETEKCDKPGKKLMECECGNSFIAEIEASGHKWSSWSTKVQATYNKNGTEERVCSVCKTTEDRNISKHKDLFSAVFDSQVSVLYDEVIIVYPNMLVKDILQESSSDIIVLDKNGKKSDIDSMVTSGMRISLKDGKDNIICTITAIVPGDNNGDGRIMASDARTALRASVKLEDLNAWQKQATNVDAFAENKITAADARYILRASVGLESIKSYIELLK